MAFSYTALTELITRIKDIVPELQSVDDNRLYRSINDAIRFLVNENTARKWRFHLTLAPDDLGTTGLVKLPDDFVAMKSVWRLNSDDGLYHESKKLERTELLRKDADQYSYASDEYYHSYRGAYLDTRPLETATVTDGIRIEYFCMPEDVGSGDDLTQFLERWRELVAYYVAKKEGIRYEDGRDELERHFNMLLGQFRRASQRDIEQPKVMRSGRGGIQRERTGFGRVR